MNPEAERELTHILLVELLAHQFAYPVRWIETQDEILGEKVAERIVEIGPSKTLTNMMKRTWETGFQQGDLSQNITRRFLGASTDQAEVYYLEGDDSSSDTASQEPIPSAPQPAASTVTAAPPESQPPVASAPVPTSQGPAEELPDVNTPVAPILLSILSTKLKKAPKDIRMSETIGRLVGGRSALTNEIIGDLHNEFQDSLPDRAEDSTLQDLCETITVSHSGKLGKQSETAVGRLISSKFPPDYTRTSIRQVLHDQWGLGPMRQDAVLVMALGQQPASRLSSSEAQAFLSDVAGAYFREQGLALPSGGARSGGDQATVYDAKALQALNEKNSALARDIMDVLQSHVQDPSAEAKSNASKTAEAEQADKNLETIDLWVSEHGDEYAEGIIPKFDVKKQRVYDSYWNWNAQDISLLVSLCRTPQPEKHAELIGQLSMAVVNRACERDAQQIAYLYSQIKEGSGNSATEKSIEKTLDMLLQSCLIAKDRDPVFVDRSAAMAPLTTISHEGRIEYCEIPYRVCHSTAKALDKAPLQLPFPVSTFHHGFPVYSHEHSISFAVDCETVRHTGFSLRGRNVLLNGAGRKSIGIRILENLLQGGARVTVTTSSYSPETMQMYQDLYRRCGSRDAVLRVLPFNQGSHNDVRNLVQYLASDPAWDLDFVVPFAAISENGRGLEEIDSRSEIAHRLMFTNLLRLLGAIAKSKRSRNIIARPATVLLPLSPNHGLMGNDGLYSESKRSLEVLLAKWSSESWNEYLSIMGVIIGWTRGTGLMDDNDVVAQGVEGMGVRTFAVDEMAANIVSLMGGSLNAQCQLGPLLVNMSGGMDTVDCFQEKLGAIRQDLHAYANICRALVDEKRREVSCVAGIDTAVKTEPDEKTTPTKPTPIARANSRLPLPTLPSYSDEIAPLAALEGMADLSRVVVITGFSELGPYGSSRTRWEMELQGALSLEGCIELAWTMGLIRFGPAGWIDTKTQAVIHDGDIPSRYLLQILEHTGIRVIEPDICDGGYDPENKNSLQELVLQRDLPPFETSPDVARNLVKKHGDKAVVTGDGSETVYVQLKAGATVMVSRAAHFDRTVAGQIPTGWSPKRYGITDDIIEQCDPVTLFSLVCTVEALLYSGIVDPYELYEHIHVSEVGICIGSSMGGLSSLRKMHRERFVDKTVQADILQETFINTTGAWINMLLTSSAGPIKTPVGACATSLESLDTGADLIIANKAKFVLVGGVEDFVEDVSYEFGSMKATCNTDAEFAAGRSPREMSRPTASSRSGFVEAQGAGVQVLTSAELALEMGLPIYGIVAYTSMSADKASRSVPAPGKGVLTNARETASLYRQPGLGLNSSNFESWSLLDINYRRKVLTRRREQISQWRRDSIALLEDQISMVTALDPDTEADRVERHRREALAAIDQDCKRQEAEAAFTLGNNFWKDGGSDAHHHISPLRGSLATWGLGIDDISVASLHGTSTVKNDLNETLVIEQQMRHLGRTEGNLIPCVCQKWLTGHSKGGAGAWMLNGALQMMDSGLVPGNRNADNVDEGLRERRYLHFPNVTLDASGTGGIKACSVTSFGFGQKGAQAILVHPRYVYATISEERYQEYGRKRDKRWELACRVFSEAMVKENLVSRCVKTAAPYAPEDEMDVLLNPGARFYKR